MHSQRKPNRRGSASQRVETPITEDQRQRVLLSLDGDLESLLLQAGEVEAEVVELLEAIDVDSDADAAALAAAQRDFNRLAELKRWICEKRAETAALA